MSSEHSTYDELLGRIQGDLALVLAKWKVHFGSGLEATWDGARPRTDHGNIPVASDAMKDLVQTAQQRLNARGRVGEASLFVRDPREDRLVLIYSTSRNIQRGVADSKQVKDPASYFDAGRRCYFYPLHDRLADARDREAEWARKSRGLTGWVAVAGHHLLVNGEYGQKGLLSLAEDRPETQGACQTYGSPIWGRHISEAPSDPDKPKRYVGVPVKSSIDGERTIGVLRYACPCAGTELAEADLILLKELSHVISATLGLEAATTRAFRESHLAHEKDHLRRTYDFAAFLRFVAVSLRSSIASVYLEVGGVLGSESRLRLVEAYGIRGSVGLLRDEIEDYPAHGGGFTRWLFDGAPHDPTVETSVHLHSSWRGKNTLVFYGEHFRKLIDVQKGGQPTEVARKYEIKIIGLPLFFEQDKLGVLKIELPNSFDDTLHYNQADQAFLKECAAVLGEVLGEFQLFLQGQWFLRPHDNLRTVVNVTRMATEVLRTRIVSPEEAKEFWKQLEEFIVENQDKVSDELVESLRRLPPDERKAVLDAGTWLGKLGRDFFSRLIVQMVLGALRHL